MHLIVIQHLIVLLLLSSAWSQSLESTLEPSVQPSTYDLSASPTLRPTYEPSPVPSVLFTTTPSGFPSGTTIVTAERSGDGRGARVGFFYLGLVTLLVGLIAILITLVVVRRRISRGRASGRKVKFSGLSLAEEHHQKRLAEASLENDFEDDRTIVFSELRANQQHARFFR